MKRERNIEFIDMPESIRDQYQYFTEARMDKLTSRECPVAFRSLEETVADYVGHYLLTSKPHL